MRGVGLRLIDRMRLKTKRRVGTQHAERAKRIVKHHSFCDRDIKARKEDRVLDENCEVTCRIQDPEIAFREEKKRKGTTKQTI